MHTIAYHLHFASSQEPSPVSPAAPSPTLGWLCPDGGIASSLCYDGPVHHTLAPLRSGLFFGEAEAQHPPPPTPAAA